MPVSARHNENSEEMENIKMIDIKDISVSYEKGKKALDKVSFTLQPGTFTSLVGPSGCGKTTMLNILAGFLAPDEGQIFVDGRDITRLEIQKRKTAMVFQNYALWPHMTIFENIAYGLKLKKMSKQEIEERVGSILDVIEIDKSCVKKRKPAELSGGQQQRIALARALVVEPTILLMDEPLSNLDAKVRQRLRIEIRDIQKKLGVTAVYVTHDQEEAMSMSDQVVVMNQGIIAQKGTPKEVYRRPQSSFVAEFLGHSNALWAKVEDGKILLGEQIIVDRTAITGKKAKIIIRANELTFDPQPNSKIRICGKLKGCMYSGSYYRYLIDIEGQEIFADSEKELTDEREITLYLPEWGVYAYADV